MRSMTPITEPQRIQYIAAIRDMLLARPCGQNYARTPGIEGYVTPFWEPEGILLAFRKKQPHAPKTMLSDVLHALGPERPMTWMHDGNDESREALIQAGFVLQYELKIMVMGLPSLPTPSDASITIREVSTREALAFKKPIAKNLDCSEKLAEAYILRSTAPSPYQRYAFKASVGEQFAGYGFLDVNAQDSLAILRMGGTLRHWRGHGVYRALFTHRIAKASELGLQAVITGAIDTTSAPLLHHMGMTSIGTIGYFQRIPKNH